MIEVNLCSFVSYLADEKLKHQTIKSYLSAVHHLQISDGHPDPFNGTPMTRLHYVLRGIKKEEAERGAGQRERLPITPSILRQIQEVWKSSGDTWDIKFLWAACCLASFSFLRAGDFTAPSAQHFDPSVHLCFQDLAIDNPRSLSLLQVILKQSKTDPFRQGVQLLIGKTEADLCPVAGLLASERFRSGLSRSLPRGHYLTHLQLVEAVQSALVKAGLDQSRYCGHSFRIGVATVADEKGMEDSVIKIFRCWDSLAYLEYICIPRASLVHYSKVLVS